MNRSPLIFILFTLLTLGSCSDDQPVSGVLQLVQVKVGDFNLNLSNPALNIDLAVDQPITLVFSGPVQVSTVSSAVLLKKQGGEAIPVQFDFLDNNTRLLCTPHTILEFNEIYELVITGTVKGAKGESFTGLTIIFKTKPDNLTIVSLKINGTETLNTPQVTNIAPTATIQIEGHQ